MFKGFSQIQFCPHFTHPHVAPNLPFILKNSVFVQWGPKK